MSHQQKNSKNPKNQKPDFKLNDPEKLFKAGLIVNEIESVDVDNAFSKVSKRIGRQSGVTLFMKQLIRVAAVLSIPLLVFTIWSLFLDEQSRGLTENDVTWQEIQSPPGMRSHVVLPDGSNLWLNAESKISYAVPFIRERRQLELEGEAFFEVAENAESPFVVYAGGAGSLVTGTEFNVKAYPEDPNIEVALKEGSVDFYYTNKEEKRVFTTLQPNDYLVLNKSTKEIVRTNRSLNKYIMWRRNIMYFDDTPMQEVATTLERWYGVEVKIVSPEIYKYKITTTFENESLFRVLELLELSSPPIEINYTRGKINQQSNKTTKSVVTITKKK